MVFQWTKPIDSKRKEFVVKSKLFPYKVVPSWQGKKKTFLTELPCFQAYPFPIKTGIVFYAPAYSVQIISRCICIFISLFIHKYACDFVRLGLSGRLQGQWDEGIFVLWTHFCCFSCLFFGKRWRYFSGVTSFEKSYLWNCSHIWEQMVCYHWVKMFSVRIGMINTPKGLVWSEFADKLRMDFFVIWSMLLFVWDGGILALIF